MLQDAKLQQRLKAALHFSPSGYTPKLSDKLGPQDRHLQFSTIPSRQPWSRIFRHGLSCPATHNNLESRVGGRKHRTSGRANLHTRGEGGKHNKHQKQQQHHQHLRALLACATSKHLHGSSTETNKQTTFLGAAHRQSQQVAPRIT